MQVKGRYEVRERRQILRHNTDEHKDLKQREIKNLPVVIVRNLSWPAVSQICNLIRLPSSSIVLILKSILQNIIS